MFTLTHLCVSQSHWGTAPWFRTIWIAGDVMRPSSTSFVSGGSMLNGWRPVRRIKSGWRGTWVWSKQKSECRHSHKGTLSNNKIEAHSQHHTIHKAEKYARGVLAPTLRRRFIKQGNKQQHAHGAQPQHVDEARDVVVRYWENKQIGARHYPVVGGVYIARIDAIIALVEVGYGCLRHVSVKNTASAHITSHVYVQEMRSTLASHTSPVFSCKWRRGHNIIQELRGSTALQIRRAKKPLCPYTLIEKDSHRSLGLIDMLCSTRKGYMVSGRGSRWNVPSVARHSLMKSLVVGRSSSRYRPFIDAKQANLREKQKSELKNFLLDLGLYEYAKWLIFSILLNDIFAQL